MNAFTVGISSISSTSIDLVLGASSFLGLPHFLGPIAASISHSVSIGTLIVRLIFRLNVALKSLSLVSTEKRR
jgi:hypothetical protein